MKWFIINDEGAYKRMLKCTKVIELRNMEEHLYKDGSKCKNETSNV
jgi:hypothetical protein